MFLPAIGEAFKVRESDALRKRVYQLLDDYAFAQATRLVMDVGAQESFSFADICPALLLNGDYELAIEFCKSGTAEHRRHLVGQSDYWTHPGQRQRDYLPRIDALVEAKGTTRLPPASTDHWKRLVARLLKLFDLPLSAAPFYRNELYRLRFGRACFNLRTLGRDERKSRDDGI